MALLGEWDAGQATTAMSWATSAPGCSPTATIPAAIMILAEFAEVDGDLTSAEEAERNNQREETEQWAAKLRDLVDGEPEWIHFDELLPDGDHRRPSDRIAVHVH